MADFNNDGIPDLAVATGQGVFILLGKGDGSFSPATPTPVSQYSSYLLAADFNADGNADLIVNGDQLLLGNGDGTFRPPSDLGAPAQAAVGDFDHDSNMDLILSYGYLLLGNGDGTFRVGFASYMPSNSSVTAADLNGDGDLDFVTGSAVYLNNGSGLFQNGIAYTSRVNPVFSVATADVNGDGKLDVLNTGSSFETSVNLGNGDGTLQDSSVVLQSAGLPYVVAGDFNGDGVTDLAVSDLNNNNVTILLGAGAGPVLTFSDTHSDPFYLGQTGASYIITVTNHGPGAAGIPITATVSLPSGLTATGVFGNGWNCDLTVVSCTNSNPLAADASYSPITLTVTVTATSVGPLVHQGTITGTGDISSTAAYSTQVIGAPITLQTAPVGLDVQFVGQNPQTAPTSMNIAPGQIDISTPTLQTAPGTQYLFSNWSDSGAASHRISVGTTPATYTTTFQTQYQLTAASYPPSGGTLDITSGTYYNAASPVTLTATPNAPLVFTGWSNGATSTSIQLTMNAPISITASFDIPGATCTMTGDTTASIADVQFVVNEALGIVAANNDLNADGAVNIADVQKVANAAMNLGCLQ